MIIEAFGQSKDVMEWLEDPIINSEVTRDVLVKRIKRSMHPEVALNTPVNKGAAIGDTKKRIADREEKMTYRLRMFVLSQKIRFDFNKGVALEEIMDKYGVSKSQVNKIGGKLEWYNRHWINFNYPEQFEKEVLEIREQYKKKYNEDNAE